MAFVRMRRFKERFTRKTEAQHLAALLQLRAAAADECMAVNAALRASGQPEGAAAALTCAQRVRDLTVLPGA